MDLRKPVWLNWRRVNSLARAGNRMTTPWPSSTWSRHYTDYSTRLVLQTCIHTNLTQKRLLQLSSLDLKSVYLKSQPSVSNHCLIHTIHMKPTHRAVLSKTTTVGQVHHRVHSSPQLDTTASQPKAFHIYKSHFLPSL